MTGQLKTCTVARRRDGVSHAGTGLLGLAEISYVDRAAAEAHTVPDDGFRALIDDLKALPGREHVIV